MRTVPEIAATIEHTLLRTEATPTEIDALCDQAVQFGFAGVCVNPVYVRRAADRLAESRPELNPRHPAVVSVCGFPLGATLTSTKVDEAKRALDDGATEIDMVIHVGALVAGDYKIIRSEIEALAYVVHAGGRRMLKIILETGVLTEAQIIAGCRCCAEGEGDFVKTSTGFHVAGGATVEHVRLLRKQAAPIRVKAAGGIRTAAAVLAMLDAGAARIGTSTGPAIMEELRWASPSGISRR